MSPPAPPDNLRREYSLSLREAFRSIVLRRPYLAALPENAADFEEALFREGLLGPLALHVARTGHPDARFHQRMIHISKEQFVQWAQYQELLLQMHASLSRLDVPVLLLKGAALRFTYSAEPGVRHISDVDLYVPDSKRAQLREALSQIGFLPYLSDSSMSQRGGAIVDIHGPTLGMTETCYGLDPLELWKQAECVPGLPYFRTLAVQNQLEYLSLHAIKHSLVRSIWLYDILLILRQRPEALVQFRNKPAGDLILACLQVWLAQDHPWPEWENRRPWGKLPQLLMAGQWHPLGQLVACSLMPSWKAKVHFLFGSVRQGMLSERPLRRLSDWLKTLFQGFWSMAGGQQQPAKPQRNH